MANKKHITITYNPPPPSVPVFEFTVAPKDEAYETLRSWFPELTEADKAQIREINAWLRRVLGETEWTPRIAKFTVSDETGAVWVKLETGQEMHFDNYELVRMIAEQARKQDEEA